MGGSCSRNADKRNTYRTLQENLKGRHHLVLVGVHGSHMMMMMMMMICDSDYRGEVSSCEHDEITAAINGGKFVD
jgi:heme/copper-type cytochrome/quinol oxidase subunit 3